VPQLLVWSLLEPWNTPSPRRTFHLLMPHGDQLVRVDDLQLQRSMESAESESRDYYVFLLEVTDDALARIKRPAVPAAKSKDISDIDFVLQAHEFVILNALKKGENYLVYAQKDIANDPISRLIQKWQGSIAQIRVGFYAETYEVDEHGKFEVTKSVLPPKSSRWSYARLIVSGLLLTLTGIGAIIGIPMLFHTASRYINDLKINEMQHAKTLKTVRQEDDATSEYQGSTLPLTARELFQKKPAEKPGWNLRWSVPVKGTEHPIRDCEDVFTATMPVADSANTP